jgi:hypothetical protein
MKLTEAELREILVYAPIGLVTVCAETVLPAVKQEVAQLRQQVPAARFIGQMATQQVQTQLRSRAESSQEQFHTVIGLGNSVMTKIAEWSRCQTNSGDQRSQSSTTAPEVPAPGMAFGSGDTQQSETAPNQVSEPLAGSEVSAASVLRSIEGYDNLSALQIISLLEDLRAEDLDEVATYEAAHRQRRTILNRIRQLREA